MIRLHWAPPAADRVACGLTVPVRAITRDPEEANCRRCRVAWAAALNDDTTVCVCPGPPAK